VVALLEEREEELADLVGGHGLSLGARRGARRVGAHRVARAVPGLLDMVVATAGDSIATRIGSHPGLIRPGLPTAP